MKKKKRYLDFYNEFIKTGKMSNDGLCNVFGEKALNLFVPEYDTYFNYAKYGDTLATSYWGYGYDFYEVADDNVRYSFTPLRQTIVLLMAAMNDEL